jgi:hypothetical protein
VPFVDILQILSLSYIVLPLILLQFITYLCVARSSAHRKVAYQKSSAQHAEFALISVVAPIKVPPSAPEMTPTTIKLLGALTDIDAKDRDDDSVENNGGTA